MPAPLRFRLSALALLSSFGASRIMGACPTGLQGYPNSRGWQSGATVTVYTIGLSSAQQGELNTAFQNWNTALNSGVTFNPAQSISSLPNTPPTPYVVVQFGNPTSNGCPSGKSACTSFTAPASSSNYTQVANIVIDTSLEGVTPITPLLAHEIGHSYGFQECDGCGSSNTIMDGSNITPSSPTGPQPCDVQVFSQIRQGKWVTGSGNGGSGSGGGMPMCPVGSGSYCTNCQPPQCSGNLAWNPQYCSCYGYTSPIVIDVENVGFHLTSAPQGVNFRELPGGPYYRMSWTDPRFGNGWLALDRNGNGIIDNLTELFGNLSSQPQSNDPNGFLALAVFDNPRNGGNGNGFIDPEDAVYSHLRVWIDANHNGISEPEELHTLQELGIFKIALSYVESPALDQFGNQFRYQSWDWDDAGHRKQMCFDVFLGVEALSN